MIIIELRGGLGNQMFQYAFGKQLSILNNTALYLDLSFLKDRTPKNGFTFRDYALDIFNLNDLNFISTKDYDEFLLENNKLLSRICHKLAFYQYGTHIFYEKSFAFDSNALNLRGNLLLKGNWQSSLYFQDISDEIRTAFSLKAQLSEKAINIKKRILKSNAVCVHVRRQDYVTLKNVNALHGSTDLEYYNNAVNHLRKNLSDFKIYIFSDDIAWCKKNLILDVPSEYVEYGRDAKDFEDFELMRTCKHFIIPNSTFSWWAAWLSDYKDKIVIAPKKWFQQPIKNKQTEDLIPRRWVRL